MNELKPDIKDSGRGFSAIWIIPIVALVIGLWMVVHNLITEGPEITVTFKTAEGLEAGKTRVKYREVVIGMVEDVSLSEDQEKVVTTIKLEREAIPMLLDDTRFWVVRARIGAEGISGLGTILSGAYIQIDPGSGKSGARTFVGLENPPLTAADAPGLRFKLSSARAGSVTAGDPITYNGYKVGRVESMTFDSESREVIYDAFIDAPYNDLVDTSTRFWNASGISVNLSADGIKVNTASMDSLLLGGVAFGRPPELSPGDPVEQGTAFRLYDSYEDILTDPFRYSVYYLVMFRQSLRGLVPGAPVEYRGIKIGNVEKILVNELVKSEMEVQIYGEGMPVLIKLEPGRLQVGDNPSMVKRVKDIVVKGVEKGMRASLQTGNLITGKLYVDIDYYENVEPAKMGEFDGYPVIPSIPTGLGRLEKQVSMFLEKLNDLPLEDTVKGANSVLATLDTTLASLSETAGDLQVFLKMGSSKQLPGELNRTLAELRKTLSSLSPDSPTGQALADIVKELSRTVRNLESFTNTLSTQPNAIVLPADLPADPEPEAP